MTKRPCKLCGAEIEFIENANEKAIPVQRVTGLYYLEVGKKGNKWLREMLAGTAPKYVEHRDVCAKYKPPKGE